MPAFKPIPQITPEIAQKFWARVNRNGECWTFRGRKNDLGYGFFLIGKKEFRAHRIAWSIANGEPFPEDKEACHTCDNPSCVNPAHIWPGNHNDNMRDCANKGRHFPGSRDLCQKGHEYTPENTLVRTRDGYRSRVCRTCHNEESTRRFRRACENPKDRIIPSHCRRGHPLAGTDNLYIRKDGWPFCKECHRELARQRYARARGERVAA